MIKVKRNYQSWVANETLEDYSLRYAARSYRRWSPFLLANTALGGISFLALEAIGGAITISYGFHNAVPAILLVSLVIFLTGLPIAYYSSKHNIDIDLLTRGAGFGYMGSTVTSLIYASFTFIFFALEAAIMAQALKIYFELPIVIGYVLCSLVIIPLVFFGVTLINRLHMWTQPVWAVLLVLPFIFILYKEPGALAEWSQFSGQSASTSGFDFMLFGAATGVLISLVAQIGEQVDYLRFLPDKTAGNRFRWWISLISAGPGWIVLGGLKILAGGFLAFLAVRHGLSHTSAIEPTRMYIEAYEYVFDQPLAVLTVVTIFVIISQVKINVTNAYAGSLAWSNFFSRVTHYHPGRVVWLVFNILIALLLMLLGVFDTLEAVLSVYSIVAISWIGAIVADLIILKPLGVSPSYIEFKRARLYDINPVGCGAMLIASVVALLAYLGVVGEVLRVYSAFLALAVSMASSVAIGIATGGRYYIARKESPSHTLPVRTMATCTVCDLDYETEDMAYCPFYDGAICSLCCGLDNHCHDSCKSGPSPNLAGSGLAIPTVAGATFRLSYRRRIGRFMALFAVAALITGAAFVLSYRLIDTSAFPVDSDLPGVLLKVYWAILVLVAVGAWWIVLSHESRELAESELVNSLHHLEKTQKELVESAKMVSLGGLVAGVAHEINTPVGITVSAASFLQDQAAEMRKTLAEVEARGTALDMETCRRFIENADHSAALLLVNAQKAAQLIQGFKQVAVDQSSDERRVFNLRDYIEETLVSLRPRLRHVSHDIQVHCPSDLYLDSYPGPLSQVLTNLLMNSLQHGLSEERPGRIRIRCRPRDDDQVEIAYDDDGSGIPPEVLPKIFDPFFTTRRSEGGSGLGLHVVYNIVTRQLCGTIEAFSREGEGTMFRLTIPRRLPHSAQLTPPEGASVGD